jgi:serine/threonine protein kinase
MNTEPKIIGKGSFGCVHKPSLKCKTRKINYKNKISKYMLKRNAKKEMKEYDAIKSADPHKYTYLGKPVSCIPDDNIENTNAMRACNLGSDLKKYSILVMNDGGENLEDFSNRFRKNPVTEENKEKIELFWIEAQRILYGLTLFLEKDIIHHDLKAQNIVYNEEKNRINFIDFGLMRSRSQMYNDYKNSRAISAINHWSYPFELQFLNENVFQKVSHWATETRHKFIENIINNLYNDENKHYRVFMSVVFGHLNDKIRRENRKIIMDDFSDFLNELRPEHYENILNMSLNTIDSYGVAIGFANVLVNTSNFISRELQIDLSNLFNQMLTNYLPYRHQPDEILREYENIMNKHGLLEKHNKDYKNHIIVDNKPSKDMKNKILHKLDKIDFTLTNSDREFLSMPPVFNCPENKEYNPNTKKCVTKCKDNKIRNENFRCVKNKTVKTKK